MTSAPSWTLPLTASNSAAMMQGVPGAASLWNTIDTTPSNWSPLTSVAPAFNTSALAPSTSTYGLSMPSGYNGNSAIINSNPATAFPSPLLAPYVGADPQAIQAAIVSLQQQMHMAGLLYPTPPVVMPQLPQLLPQTPHLPASKVTTPLVFQQLVEQSIIPTPATVPTFDAYNDVGVTEGMMPLVWDASVEPLDVPPPLMPASIGGTTWSSVARKAPAPASAQAEPAPAAKSASPYNPAHYECSGKDARFFIIKSFNEDDVHKSIKYNAWTSTQTGNRRLDQAFQERPTHGHVYLCFSVNGSGHFCGVAEMTSAVDYNTSLGYWAQEGRWTAQFSLKWIFVKDVPNAAFKHLNNPLNKNNVVTFARDTQEMPAAIGAQVCCDDDASQPIMRLAGAAHHPRLQGRDEPV